MTLRAQGFLGATGWRRPRPGWRPCCAGSARCSWTRSACWPGRMSWSPTPGSARCRGSGSSGPTGIPASRSAFEYWSHAACVLPIEQWPWYAFRRRALRARGTRWHQSHEGTCAEGAGPAARRGPADRAPSSAGPRRRSVVGLVGDEDRGRVAAGRGRGHLRRGGRLAARLRPARAGAARRAAGRGAVRPGVPGPPGRGGGPGARRGHPRGPGRLPPAAATSPRGAAHAAGRRLRAGGRAGPGHDRRGRRRASPGVGRPGLGRSGRAGPRRRAAGTA